MKKHKIFKANPHLKDVHQTSDGELFYNDNDAKMHAKTLEDKKVEVILNPDHIVVDAEDISEDEDQAAEEKLTQETKAAEEKAAAEKLAKEKATAEKLAQEKAAAEKLAQEKDAADKKNTKK
jgi:membrane protein involved in colicin uptake